MEVAVTPGVLVAVGLGVGVVVAVGVGRSKPISTGPFSGMARISRTDCWAVSLTAVICQVPLRSRLMLAVATPSTVLASGSRASRDCTVSSRRNSTGVPSGTCRPLRSTITPVRRVSTSPTSRSS